jgi:hypothetical protein
MQILMLTTCSELPHTSPLATCVDITGAFVSEFSNQLKSILKELHMHSFIMAVGAVAAAGDPADLFPLHRFT